MQANPILVEATRGELVENIHRGAWCFCNSKGHVEASAGDLDRLVFPRSAAKVMQAMAMFVSGAVDKFRLDDEMIALACASHNGKPRHAEKVTEFLTRIGCAVDDLECGSQPPTNRAAREALRDSGQKPSALFNNCSGKHAGMLAVAKALSVPHQGYAAADHPVQVLVRQCMEQILGAPLTPHQCGTDGCSIPTWGAPLKSFAIAYARMATGEELPPEMVAPAKRAFDAATSYPFLVRGTGTLDTDVMQAFNGRLMVKFGADGIYCGAVRDRGIGFALKIDDGSLPASDVAIANLLLQYARPDEGEKVALNAYAKKTLTNRRKLVTGELRAVK